VRDAAGQPADRFHLLRLQELPLQLTPFGHVAIVVDDRADRRVGEQVREDAFQLAPRAVRVFDARVDVDVRARLFQRALDAADHERMIVGMDELERAVAHEIVQLVAQHARRRRARIQDAAVGAEQRHRVPAVLDERAEALFAGFERGLRVLLFVERAAERDLDAAAARDGQRDDERDADVDEELNEAIERPRRDGGTAEQNDQEADGGSGRRP
jgi:hypothetical protein